MAAIRMYTTTYCPYCVRAKDLLKRKGVQEIEEIDVTNDAAKREEMMEVSGGRKTVPQIFIGQTHVGGFDDLHKLDTEHKLDSLLKAEEAA